MRNLYIIVFLFLMILPSCRSRKDVVSTTSRDLWQEINLEMRRLDSVSLQNESFNRVEIDYYFPVLDSAQNVMRAIEPEGNMRGAVQRIVVETGQKSLQTRCVADTASVSEARAESDFKSVEAVSKEKNNTLPLMVAIVALSVAVCFLISYRRHK